MNKTPIKRACNLTNNSQNINIEFSKPRYYLYILVDNACQSKCKFCVQANNNDITFNMNNFINVIDKLKVHTENTGTIISKINFTGGEPLLNFEKFKQIFNTLANKMNLEDINIILNTNGYNIDKLYDEEDIMNYINHVSFSRHHYNDEKNAEIFGTNNIPTEKDLKKFVSKYCDSVWFRCNTIKGYIDNIREVEKYCDWCIDIGCKHCGFSTLRPFNDYCIDKFVNIDIKKSNKIEELASHFKYDTNNNLVCSCNTSFYKTNAGFCDIVNWDDGARCSDGILVFNGHNLLDNFSGNIIW